MTRSQKTKLASLLLAGLLLLPTLASCAADGDEPKGTQADTGTGADTEAAIDPVDQAISDLRGQTNWGGEDFGILYSTAFDSYREEVEAKPEGGSVINDAVFERNTLFQEYCNLNFVLIPTTAEAYNTSLTKGIQTGTKDFYITSQGGSGTAAIALQGYLYNYLDLDIDYDREWWDQGTLNFALDGRVFFMNGPFNTIDDDCTYIIAFNKNLQREHRVPNPYQTVRDHEWTMEYMNSIISNLSTDNGDGSWDENDTYGLTATSVISTAFFYGAGLKYVDNSLEKDVPELILSDKLDRVTEVMDITRKILHENNSTHVGIGMEIFINDRALFGFEVVNYLRALNAQMNSEYGVLPVPKYDKAQEQYYSFSNAGVGTTLSIPTSVAQVDMNLFANTLEMYCLLSQKLVKPAYYEITLMTRNIQDLDSAEMLDIVFQHRIYDLAAYFDDLGLAGIFEQAASGTSDTFSSKYSSASRAFDKKVKNMLVKLQRHSKN
ncbi:MAG: hypothetical protein E7610_02170 [Ruminococcaceae bacterium]|nr:hypothetical protein [Oscillospiraceae bacterium]